MMGKRLKLTYKSSFYPMLAPILNTSYAQDRAIIKFTVCPKMGGIITIIATGRETETYTGIVKEKEEIYKYSNCSWSSVKKVLPNSSFDQRV